MSDHGIKIGSLINTYERLCVERYAADFLGVTPRALQSWRQRGGGPPYVRISSRAIRYRYSDLIRFCEERLRLSTSEYGDQL